MIRSLSTHTAGYPEVEFARDLLALPHVSITTYPSPPASAPRTTPPPPPPLTKWKNAMVHPSRLLRLRTNSISAASPSMSLYLHSHLANHSLNGHRPASACGIGASFRCSAAYTARNRLRENVCQTKKGLGLLKDDNDDHSWIGW